jgi:mRNA interferase YafQ
LARRKRKPEPAVPPPPPPPLAVRTASQFERDVKRLEKQGKDMDKLLAIVGAMRSRQSLPPKNKDHPLTGQWKGARECHIEPDWLLIYERGPDWLRLVRTGSHSELELE